MKSVINFVLSGILLISLFGFTSAIPYILFVDPTPSDVSIINTNSVIINISVSDYSTSFIDFDGSLLGWWRMNNETGENSSFARDYSSYGKNGTVIGGTYNSSEGKLGGGFVFNGLSDYIDISFSENFLTRALWKKDSGGEWIHITEVINKSILEGEEWTHYLENYSELRVTSNHAPSSLYEHDSYVIKEKEGKLISSPVINGDYLYIAGKNGEVYMFKISDGNLIANVKKSFLGGLNISTPVILDDYIYFASDNGNVYQLNKFNLSITNFYSTGGILNSPPVIANEYLYIGCNESRLCKLSVNNLSFIDYYETEGSIASIPNISGGYIYFGSKDNKVYQLNETDLSLVNFYKTGDEILSSPAVINGYLYIGSKDNKVYQLNASNVSNLISSYTTTGDVFSSPKFLNNSIYLGNDEGMLYQLNASNISNIISNYNTGAKVRNSITPYENYIYVASNNSLYKFNSTNLSNGFSKFTVSYSGINGEIAPAIDSNFIYLLFEYSFNSNIFLFKYNYTNLTRLDSFLEFSRLGIKNSPAVAKGYLYFGSDLGEFYQLNASTMDLVNTFYTNFGSIFSAPLIINDSIYFGSGDFNVYQLNASNITQKISSYKTGARVSCSPAVSNGYLYIGGYDNIFYQLNASNVSHKISNYTTQGTIISSPILSEGYIYFGSGDKNIYQLNASNVSHKISNYTTGSYASASLAIAYGYLYGGSYDNYVYQLNASNVSQMVTKFNTGDDVASSITVSNGYVYVGSDNNKVYQLNASNISQVIAEYITGSKVGVGNGVVIAEDYAFVSSYDGFLYQLNASNISQNIFNFKLGDKSCQSYPAIVNGYVYVSDANKKIYKLGEGKTYINGVENTSNYTFPVYKNNEKIEIGRIISGEFYNGSIDEVVFFKNDLNSYEINALYNSTAYTNFYHNFENLDEDTYFYTVYSQNSSGYVYSLRRSFIFNTLSNTNTGDEDEEESSSGSEFKEITLNKNSLKKGFNLNVKENLEIEIPVDGLSENKRITVKDINPNTDEVVLTSGSEEYSLLLGEGIKIDLDNNGYYDIEVINKKNYGTVSNLEFKSIYEKIQAEEQEEVIEEVEKNVNEKDEVVSVEKESKVLKLVVIIIVIVILVLIILFSHKKIKRKKRYKKFGY